MFWPQVYSWVVCSAKIPTHMKSGGWGSCLLSGFHAFMLSFLCFARLHAQWTLCSIAWDLPSQVHKLTAFDASVPKPTLILFLYSCAFMVLYSFRCGDPTSFPLLSKNDSNSSSMIVACLQAWEVGVASQQILKRGLLLHRKNHCGKQQCKLLRK